MKQFYCDCGQAVFFDSNSCLNCGRRLGFDPRSMTMVALEFVNNRWQAASGQQYKLCDNGLQFDVCNWLLPADSHDELCVGCRFNRTVPNQSIPGNDLRWRRLEEGKKRLLYTLLQLGLPLESGWDNAEYGLLFDFIEDQRSDDRLGESFVHTGFLGGVITINALEADDLEREAQRLQMNENYRTVLGHLRHESGHYFWHRLNPDAQLRHGFEQVFGDETADYEQTLDRYYSQGPAGDWQHRYISAYASAHPTEDWAETWGHYLHIYDALETAAAHGLTDADPVDLTIDARIERWAKLSVTLNELNRSIGSGDAYPFVFNESVAEKLRFVDRVISLLQTPSPKTANH
ncbi:MAG: putative zinc-binding metallopeptidase [Pseudomonadota bacterium]